MTTVGIGLVGFGWMGQAHSRAYRDLPVYFQDAGIRPRLVVESKEVEVEAEVVGLAD